MVERRKPLVLSSTKSLVNSVLNSSTTVGRDGIDRTSELSGDNTSPSLQLRAGILRLSKDQSDISNTKVSSLDDAALVGLSTSLLKRLSITSGSLVMIKNLDTSIQRIGQAVVLDPPNAHDESTNNELSAPTSSRAMIVFPLYSFPQIHHVPLTPEVVYVSPIFAFNLKLNVSCLKLLVYQGKENLGSLFDVKEEAGANEKGDEGFSIDLGVEPWAEFPRYASHLRISFVKIPECGTIESLRGSSSVDSEDRQEMIDLALNEYFAVDRYLARGDLFSICINWKCKSAICIACCRKMQASDNIIYFKVVGMEPSDEQVLKVNRSQTAVVLGASLPSAIPPDLLLDGQKGFAPLQGDTVKTLASILTPPLCPSALSSKFRVAILLSGLTGCGKRTVVKHVARQLGLHVVEYSCHNLMTSSERKTSAMLAQAFTTARRYSPTILLLRHFDVFRNLAPNEGSPQDRVGVTSEVAFVIREFTEPVGDDEDNYFEEETGVGSRIKVAQAMITHPVLLVAAADSSEGLPPTVRRCFSHEVSMGPLTEEQRVEMLSQSLQCISELLPNILLVSDCTRGSYEGHNWADIWLYAKGYTCFNC